MQNTALGNGIHQFHSVSVQPTGSTDAVIWHSNIRLDEGGFISYGTPTKVSAKTIESHPSFHKVALAAQLGIPLGSVPISAYMPNSNSDPEDITRNNAHMSNGNIFANYLHVSINTDDPLSFSYNSCPPFEGDVLFIRLDHGPLNVRQMHALEQFCCSMKHFIRYRDQVGTKSDPKAFAREILNEYNPKAFARFFEEQRRMCILKYKQQGLGESIKEWEGTECPVIDLCGAANCLKGVEEVEGGKLEVCSRCKVKRYCGKSCQKEDWGRHKRSCRKAKA
ncbi:hypothetical protein HII31_09390 [Pseudocercospora fuligena]|uniref:MYND-type domain-containing protein n=1 Tax=Pseudocercospora fuligena TaxID=685502 RepID=A0A8H6VG44_9PEZI|nr:hypothetical protein HII31_09390 [Pseudocercospora fuligena]